MIAAAVAALALAAPISTPQRRAIDALITKTLHEDHIAGASVAVAINGTTAYDAAFGLSDVAAGMPAATTTSYPIGSITKQFTAACIMLLARDGRLALDDPLSRYVPELPWGERVTLRHLLDQESGIVDFRLGVLDTSSALAHGDVVDRLKQTDLLFAPGSQYAYSNSNYYLLGMVIEKVSGESYARFLRERVLTPLGLYATYYDDGSSGEPKPARGTLANSDGPQPVPPENADWSFAAGALASTTADLIRWDDSLRNGALLDKASLQEVFTPGTLDNGDATDYAFGWVVEEHNGHREVWHNGEVTGYHAMNATYPDDRTDVVVLTNTGGTFAADALALQIFDVLHPYVPTSADRAAAARAKEWLSRIERGDVDRSQLTDQLSAALADSMVQSSGKQLRSFGKMQAIVPMSMDEDASGRNYTFDVRFAHQTIKWIMGIDRAGKISALAFRL